MVEQIKNIPPPPKKPDEYECCGRGCSPCIFDYYQIALRKWQQQYSISDNDQLFEQQDE